MASLLPAHILIPLANPRTAADLVRIGSALMQPGGSLTALGIVEVPEGMALSEGATHARQARRLLQRVLEFAPPGVDLRTVVRIGRRAAEGIVELAAEEEADLIIFGWGGRSGGKKKGTEAVFSPTIDEVVRDSPCNIAVVKQRGIKDVDAHPGAGPRRAARRTRARLRVRARPPLRCPGPGDARRAARHNADRAQPG